MPLRNKINAALFCALAALLSVMESYILPFTVYKIGLANVIVLYFLYKRGKGLSFLIVIVKTTAFVLVGGVTIMLLFRIISNAAAFLVMVILKKRLSVLALSVSGSVVNLTIQFTLYSLIVLNLPFAMIYNVLGFIILFASGAGLLTGALAYTVLKSSR